VSVGGLDPHDRITIPAEERLYRLLDRREDRGRFRYIRRFRAALRATTTAPG
jgi:hypothetical protein